MSKTAAFKSKPAISVLYKNGDTDVIEVKSTINSYTERTKIDRNIKTEYYVIKSVGGDTWIQKDKIDSIIPCFILE